MALFFPLFSFAAFITYLFLGIQVFRMEPSSSRNRWFLAFCMSFAVWSFAYIFVYPDHPKDQIWFWYRISSIGWCAFPAISLNFMISLTRFGRRKNAGMTRDIFRYALFLPSIVFIVRAFSGTLIAKDFTVHAWGNIEVQDISSPWYWAYLIYMGFTTISGLLLVALWGIKTSKKNEKKQSLWIVTTGVIALTTGVLFNILLPSFSHVANFLPAIAPLTGLIWMVGIRRAIRKYRLLEISPQIAAEEIISNIIDVVFLLNPDGSFRKANRSSEILLGYSENELKKKNFGEIFEKSETARYKLLDIRKCVSNQLQWEDSLKPLKGKMIPMNCLLSCVKDHSGNAIGMLFVGQDLRLVKRLEKEVKRSEIAERKLEKAKETLELKVAERTRELERFATTDPMTGIYNRRIGLLLLDEEIRAAKRKQSVLTVCFIDINGLKTVNDEYGHKEGDDLILSIVNILKENLRESDVLCRMGGDEFLAIMLDCNLNQCLEVWDGIQKSIDEKNNRKQKSYLLSVSRGLAEYNPIYPMTLDELITTADYQMYQNKKKLKKVIDGD